MAVTMAGVGLRHGLRLPAAGAESATTTARVGVAIYAVSWFSSSLSAARFLFAASLSSFFCSASTSLE